MLQSLLAAETMIRLARRSMQVPHQATDQPIKEVEGLGWVGNFGDYFQLAALILY